MGCGCGGKSFSGSGSRSARRGVAQSAPDNTAAKVVYSPDVKKVGSPSGAVPLTKRTVV